MKTTLALGLLTLSLTAAHAGVLVNKVTGEFITFRQTETSVLMDATKAVGIKKTIDTTSLKFASKDSSIMSQVIFTESALEVSEARFNRIYKRLDSEAADSRRQLMNILPLQGEAILPRS